MVGLALYNGPTQIPLPRAFHKCRPLGDVSPPFAQSCPHSQVFDLYRSLLTGRQQEIGICLLKMIAELNIHIYRYRDRIEQGVNEKGTKYCKIFYEEEY
jgi:hypothetical protein